MKHGHARSCIPLILETNGFDRRAEALVHAAVLASDDILEPALCERLQRAALQFPADQGDLSHAPHLSSPLPDSVEELCAQLAPTIIDQPQEIATQLCSLQQLCSLWPHANREERTQLRLNWLGTSCIRQAPTDSYLTRATLRKWQRDLPTVGENGQACAAVLCDMLQSTSAKDAYNCLSLYLGSQADLPTLAWTLGVLSEQILLHHFDPRGHSIRALVGTIACEQLVSHTRPEVLVTLISQLAHYIWWTAQMNRQRSLAPSRHRSDICFLQAVSEGDIYAAQKAARLSLADRPRFWSEVSHGLHLVLDAGHHSWTYAMAAVVAVRYRGGERGVLSPDDAATIGAALASAKYRADHHSSRLVAIT
ncbi:MAG: hypothetical protein EA402_14035 [Planctomycetota bacterium]|nr:MAG: hypothetical protein EA402_14035 [Planctomycetota bacterium]